MSKLVVVIVAFESEAFLTRCLAALRKSTYRNFDVVVVDNSRHQGLFHSLPPEIQKEIRYDRPGRNLGFCEGNNFGAKIALELGATHLLLLNHDTEIASDCLEKMMACAEQDPRIGAVTCKILMFPDGSKTWYAGGKFSVWLGAGKNDGFLRDDQAGDLETREVTYATGCCMLVPLDLFLRLGGLKNSMFMYLDDIEFCLRIRKTGFKIFYVPSTWLLHELGSGASLKQRPDYYLYFSIRNKPLVANTVAYRYYLHAVTALVAFVKLIQFSVVPGISQRAPKLKAIFFGWVDSFSSSPKYFARFPRLFKEN